MSTIDTPTAIANFILAQSPLVGLRLPTDNINAPSAPTRQLVYTPDLTAAEQTTFDDLSMMAKFGVTMTLAEWQGIKADAANLKAYLGVASPTLVQTAAATKAIIRVLATIVRS